MPGTGRVHRRVSRVAYWTPVGPGPTRQDAEPVGHVIWIRRDSRGAYRTPRVHAELAMNGDGNPLLDENWTIRPVQLAKPPGAGLGHLRTHRGVPQPEASALDPRISESCGVRKGIGHHREKSQRDRTVRRVALECPRNQINSTNSASPRLPLQLALAESLSSRRSGVKTLDWHISCGDH